MKSVYILFTFGSCPDISWSFICVFGGMTKGKRDITFMLRLVFCPKVLLCSRTARRWTLDSTEPSRGTAWQIQGEPERINEWCPMKAHRSQTNDKENACILVCWSWSCFTLQIPRLWDFISSIPLSSSILWNPDRALERKVIVGNAFLYSSQVNKPILAFNLSFFLMNESVKAR